MIYVDCSKKRRTCHEINRRRIFFDFKKILEQPDFFADLRKNKSFGFHSPKLEIYISMPGSDSCLPGLASIEALQEHINRKAPRGTSFQLSRFLFGH
jgi:hypothetical protein